MVLQVIQQGFKGRLEAWIRGLKSLRCLELLLDGLMLDAPLVCSVLAVVYVFGEGRVDD
jgi:hypothetical protein